MQFPQSFYSDPISDELRSLVLNLLEIIEQMRVKDENQQGQIEALQKELRHLKKLKGKPRIRPNVPDPEPSDQEDEQPDPDNNSSPSANRPPPKSKRPKPFKPGETAAPKLHIDHEQVCPAEGFSQTGGIKASETIPVAFEVATALATLTHPSHLVYLSFQASLPCRLVATPNPLGIYTDGAHNTVYNELLSQGMLADTFEEVVG